VKAFAYVNPTSEKDAVAALKIDGVAMPIGGGQDILARMKDYITQPDRIVNIKNALDTTIVAMPGGGLKIGAAVKIVDLMAHAQVRRLYPAITEAAGLIGTPQIRNQGTVGGNVSQDARCWYYRAGWPCYRAGGNICYADTPDGRNREHAILHAQRCVAVNPSDTAPALIALDARFVLQTAKGERVISAEDYFVGPDIDITRLNILRPGDLLSSIRIPPMWAGARFYFEKIRDRAVWDFPLLNVASAMTLSGDRIERIRIAVNAVAARPLRLAAVERAVTGKANSAATGEMAGNLAVQGAVPLQFNSYKIPLMRNLVKRAVAGEQEATWTSYSGQ